MGEQKVGGWDTFWSANGWGVRRDLTMIAHGPETGDLGKAHADAALCEHGLVPWPCAACGGECEAIGKGRVGFSLHRDYWDGPEIPICAACGGSSTPTIERLASMFAERALYPDGSPLLAAWLRASATPKSAPETVATTAQGAAQAMQSFAVPPVSDHLRELVGKVFGSEVHQAMFPQRERDAADRAREAADAARAAERAKADAARRARLRDPEVRADLDSLPRALRACADEVDRAPLPLMSVVDSRAVATRLRMLAEEVAARQEQDGYVWAGCYYVSDRPYPHERLGLVYAHRASPSAYVALQLTSWSADVPRPGDPWEGWARTSATDAAKAGT